MSEAKNESSGEATTSSELLGAVCGKRSCQICDKADAIERLRGQLQNCVDHLHYFSRRGYGDKVLPVIERANKVLYETLGT